MGRERNMRENRRQSRGLALAFGAVVAAFVAATFVADWRTFAIDRETDSLLGNALPSIEYLGDVNGAVRDIEAFVDESADVGGEKLSTVQAKVDDRWREIDALLAHYRALPRFPGEDELYAEVPVALRDFDAVVRATLLEVEKGAVDHARIDADVVVRPRANRMTHLMRQLVRLNSENAVDATRRIDATRHATVAVSAALNVVAILLTIVAATWVFRLVRAHDALLGGRLDLEEKRTAELELFGQRVAHDLLSPLSSLTFCLQAFKKASEQDPKLEHALERARQCVVRAQRLVDNVFDFARSGGAPDPAARIDVREAVEEVVAEARPMAESERVEILVGPLPDCAVRCSRGVLASILGNLLRNAVKFMGDSVERRATIRVTDLGDQVRFQVSDTGPGIAPGLEATLFQPYVRGEGVTQSGLGLGLATVKRFCEAYHGSVVVRSVTGRGSVFQVTLRKAPASTLVAPPSVRELLAGDVS